MKTLWIVGICVGAAGCAHGFPMAMTVPATASTTLGDDDVFDMTVYDEGDLSGVYRVASDGTVVVPLAGQVHVASLTPDQAAESIAKALAPYLRQPHVSVTVKEYHSKKISVFGEVRAPGTFSYTEGMNIVQAITLAGGFERLADQAGALVTRKEGDQEQRLQVSVKAIGEGREPNFPLRPGDIVYVPETYF